MDVDALDGVLLAPFDSLRRASIMTGLRAFMNELSAFQIPCEVWLDGSFTTQKPDPDDADVVVALDRRHTEYLTLEKKQALRALFDRAEAKMRFMCDVYYFPADEDHDRAYWLGQFGFGHDRATAKGIIRVRLP